MHFDPQSNQVPEDGGFVPPSAALERSLGGGRLGARGAIAFVVGVLALIGGWFFFAVGAGPGRASAAMRPYAASAPARVAASGPVGTAIAPEAPEIVVDGVSAAAPAGDGAIGYDRAIRFEDVFERGRAEMAAGRFAEAIVLLREATTLEPARADVRYKLALACIRSRAYEDAREQHAALVELDPNLANLVWNLLRGRTGALHAGAGSGADGVLR